MTRRRFLLSMFAASTLLALGVKLPKQRITDIWMWNKEDVCDAKGNLYKVSTSLISFDEGATWHDGDEIDYDGARVAKWIGSNGLVLQQPNPELRPTYHKVGVEFNGFTKLSTCALKT